MPKIIELEMWEINLILNALAELPYKRTAATIQRIKWQIDFPNNCRECQDNQNCNSYYGGSMCKHKEVIHAAILQEQAKA